jgi:hypothetical protein
MLKVKLLLVMICAGTVAMSQQKNPTDTIPKRDTANAEEVKESVLENIPTVSLDDNDLGDAAAAQTVSSLLTAGRDPFYSAASFNFSAVRFRIRGYENDLFSTYINGIPMDNLDNGFTPFGLWGGLNDVFRNRDNTWGLHNTTFSFGEIGGNTNIDARASKQRVQTSVSYAASNRNYDNRIMITHSTGLNKKGWAFTVSGSRRWADEGYVPGTYYNAWGYFVGIDKQINQRQLLSLTVFGAPTENGRQGASVQEMYDLAGTHFYNPNWGYQNGKKRNVSIGKTNQPVAILTHDFRINNKTSLVTAAGFSFGNRSVTAFDWYNAADPRPDYYRYLPSYTSTWSSVPDSTQGAMLYDLMKNDINYRQVNWQNLYNVNRAAWDTIHDANGIAGNNVIGHRSHYIVEERIINTQRFNANSVINTRLGSNIDFTAGASFQVQNNHYYKKVNDLLGGDFYVNVNQFAERDFPVNNTANQYDLDHPNRILHVGDKFGYDYNININKADGWAQGVMKLAKVDLFLAGEISYTSFYRDGHVRNGLFPDNSGGKGETNNFTNYGGKVGVTYKINGRNYIYGNAAYETRAPYFENVYISPRTNNIEQNNIESETIQTAEAGYIMNAPRLKIRIGGYYTRFQNGMDVMSFYHDGYQNFVNYAINGIDKLHFGGEFGVEAKLTSSLTINAAAAVGRYYYDSKQNAVITVDNSASILGQQIVYAENFRVPSTPMEAYSLGLNYRSPKFWFVSLTGNYFDESYLSFNPLRRTWEALQYADPKSDTYHKIFDQTKFDAQFTIDFFGGYSWKLPKSFEVNHKNTFLVFNVGVNNILNNKDIVTGGYEQLRYDAQTASTDKLQVDKFPPKLFYAYGLNFFSSVTVRF